MRDASSGVLEHLLHLHLSEIAYNHDTYYPAVYSHLRLRNYSLFNTACNASPRKHLLCANIPCIYYEWNSLISSAINIWALTNIKCWGCLLAAIRLNVRIWRTGCTLAEVSISVSQNQKLCHLFCHLSTKSFICLLHVCTPAAVTTYGCNTYSLLQKFSPPWQTDVYAGVRRVFFILVPIRPLSTQIGRLILNQTLLAFHTLSRVRHFSLVQFPKP